MSLALVMALAYLIGAIPTSFLAGRLGAGIDLRQHGSKNLGATNVYRVLGLKFALPVALFDVFKGTAPVLWLAPLAGSSDWVPLAVGAAAIMGHVFPVYLRFKGGKGVATAAGVMIGAGPLPFLVSAGLWVGILAATRVMSLASMTGAVAFPVAARILEPDNGPLLGAGVAIATFIVFTHRANLRRLLRGEEPKLGRRAAESEAT